MVLVVPEQVKANISYSFLSLKCLVESLVMCLQLFELSYATKMSLLSGPLLFVHCLIFYAE